MTTDVKWYRCPQCGALQWAADLGTPWAGVGWTQFTIDGGERITSHECALWSMTAEPLAALPAEVVLS